MGEVHRMNDPPADLDDQALLIGIVAGDEAALEEVVRRYHARLWRYVSRRVSGDLALIEDVLQEVFLAVWHGAARFRGEASVAVWIFGIAHFQTLHALRTRQRGADIIEFPEEDSAFAPVIPSAEDAALRRIHLMEALGRLSPAHREVLDLVCLHGFSMQETGEILGIPPGTVKSRLSLARRALVAALQKGARS
jgi:RNA polymerase sigma-70 factor, ECF subfamily